MSLVILRDRCESTIQELFITLPAAATNERIPFADNRDRSVFLDMLKTSVGNYEVRVDAYVLMSNRFHLIVETPKGLLLRLYTFIHNTLPAFTGASEPLNS